MSFIPTETNNSGWLGDLGSERDYILGPTNDGVCRNGITIVAWVKAAAASWNQDTSETFAGMWRVNTGPDGGYELRKYNAGTDDLGARAVQHDDAGGNTGINYIITAGNGTPYYDTWFVIAAHFAHDTDYNVSLGDSLQTTSATSTQRVVSGIRYFSIGQRSNGVTPADIAIAEVAFFKRKLTKAEIDRLSLGGKFSEIAVPPWTVAPHDCIGYYPLRTPAERLIDESPLGMGPVMTRANGSGSWSDDHPKVYDLSAEWARGAYRQFLRRSVTRPGIVEDADGLLYSSVTALPSYRPYLRGVFRGVNRAA